jgi:hypothetical protein
MAPDGMGLRPFGTSLEDLEVDLTSEDRVRVVTDVLAACGPPGRDLEFYWDLPVSARTAGLLGLAALDGADAIDVELRCPDCSQPLEISLGVDELLDREGSAIDRLTLVAESGVVMELRRPTGRDQATWAATAFTDERAWRQAAASRICDGTGALDDEMLDRIERALDEADPLLRAAVETACPDCGAVSQQDVDLIACALERLRRAQHIAIETVHQMASHYHWSEAEILAMPPWRRERYLSLLAREAAR